MLKHIIASSLFLFIGTACAAQNEPPAQVNSEPDLSECDYEGVRFEAVFPTNFSVSSTTKAVDPDSLEHLITTKIAFDDGGSAIVEQKYCTMYNFEVSYSLAKISDQSFAQALENIDRIAKAVISDFKFKAPLPMVIDLNMNQRDLTLAEAFDFPIPNQAVKSSQNTEQSFTYSPADKSIKLYVGIGGL